MLYKAVLIMGQPFCYPKYIKRNTFHKCQDKQDVERMADIMKGYVVHDGYMGYVNGKYMLFSCEEDYREYLNEE